MYKLQIAVRVLKGRRFVKVIPFKGYINIKYLYIAGDMFASETAFLLYFFFFYTYGKELFMIFLIYIVFGVFCFEDQLFFIRKII